MTAPLRIGVGTEPKTRLAACVLEFSLRRRTQSPLEIFLLEGEAWEPPTRLPQRTGFSLRRFLIPERLGYQGQALYLDADILCLCDIARVFTLLSEGCGALAAATCQASWRQKMATFQSSVMLMDLPSWQPEFSTRNLWKLCQGDYENFMNLHFLAARGLVLELERGYNHLDAFWKDSTHLLHYSRENTQPWYHPQHPHARLWETELREGISQGAVPREIFQEAVRLWGAPRLNHKRPCQGLHPHYHPLIELYSH